MTNPRIYAKDTPDKPAYIMARTGYTVTYGELETSSNRISQYFRDIGLQPQSKIAILLENHPRFLEIIRACHVAGLHYAAVSTHFKKPEIEYIINDCEAEVLITSAHMRDLAGDLLDSTPNVKHRLMLDDTIPGYESFEEVIAGYPATTIPEDIDGRDILYSSGTTGRPKGVKCTFEEMPFGELHPSHQIMTGLVGINRETVYLSPAPLYHAAPLKYCFWVMALGGTIVVMDKFDAEEALMLIEKYQVNVSQWVPTMLIRMLKLPEQIRTKYDLSSMRVAVHSAAPCPVEVKEKMIDWWGPILFEYYSGTESYTFSAITSDQWLGKKGSVGPVFIGTMHILDDDGNELPAGEPGNIYIEGGNPFEYHNDSDKTAAAHNSKGWSTIGDVGYLDEQGFLFLTDRKANMIISGGVNIYPQETENILALHPKVVDVAVIGVPNEEFGEEVKAIVQPEDMAGAGPELEAELIAYCRERISHIKCPKTIDFNPELPRTPTGKLLKRLLKTR